MPALTLAFAPAAGKGRTAKARVGQASILAAQLKDTLYTGVALRICTTCKAAELLDSVESKF
jgi:hypothetical protein